MDFLKSLMPGQVLIHGQKKIIYLGIVPGIGYLFENGLLLDRLVPDVGIGLTSETKATFAVSEIAMSKLETVRLDVSKLVSWMVVLEVDSEKVAAIRKIVVVDKPHNLVFDENGVALNPDHLIFDTGTKHQDFLSDIGQQLVASYYPAC